MRLDPKNNNENYITMLKTIKVKILLIAPILAFISCSRSNETGQTGNTAFDIVIYGSTPSGIAAAVAASREGKTCIIIDPHKQIGGMPASGMSNLDFRTYESIGGFCKAFMDSATIYYRRTSGLVL